MKFVTFRTPKPKTFHYNPRFYDPEKEELERKKAAMGYESSLSDKEILRMQMSRRWRKNNQVGVQSSSSKLISYFIYTVVIVGGLYLILFTDFVEKLVTVFTAGR